MPKTEIDYSNTIIYKITCKDASVNDLYVGHTTNFVQRKHAHKNSCINEKSCNYKCKLYNVIRNKGGWNNWKMEIIGFYECVDHYEARKKEQEFFISLNANLNSIEPFPKQKVPNKIKKNEINENKINENKINENKINENENKINENKNLKKNLPRFFCEACDFKCYMKCDWNRHLLRPKHLSCCDGHVQKIKNLKKTYFCDCGKNFLSNSGLWKHKKICNEEIKPVQPDNYEPHDKDLIMMLVKQNSELLEVIKNGTYMKNLHNNTN